jgi:hypothetical protein
MDIHLIESSIDDYAHARATEDVETLARIEGWPEAERVARRGRGPEVPERWRGTIDERDWRLSRL